jgi:hypothetical protein
MMDNTTQAKQTTLTELLNLRSTTCDCTLWSLHTQLPERSLNTIPGTGARYEEL